MGKQQENLPENERPETELESRLITLCGINTVDSRVLRDDFSHDYLVNGAAGEAEKVICARNCAGDFQWEKLFDLGKGSDKETEKEPKGEQQRIKRLRRK